MGGGGGEVLEVRPHGGKRHNYVAFLTLLGIYSLGLTYSKPLAMRVATAMRWKLKHACTYKEKTKYTAPVIGLPLLVALVDRTTDQGWHWWFSGVCLVLLSVTFHGELVSGPLLRLVQRFDQTVAAYHFAYHLWLALCVGSILGLVFLSLIVCFYFAAWIHAYTHTMVHICAALAGLAILAAQVQIQLDVSPVPFVLS